MTVKFPDIIYLQCDEDWCDTAEGQTWCEDRVFEDDVEYLRSDLVDAMKEGVSQRIADLEKPNDDADRLRKALQEILVETNFISLQAARSYIREVLGLPLG